MFRVKFTQKIFHHGCSPQNYLLSCQKHFSGNHWIFTSNSNQYNGIKRLNLTCWQHINEKSHYNLFRTTIYIPAKNIRISESIRYFQGGIKRGKWHEMGYSRVLYCFYDFLQLNKRQICHHIETNIENNGNFIKKINWLVSLWWQL